jgi:hypothetical protein
LIALINELMVEQNCNAQGCRLKCVLLLLEVERIELVEMYLTQIAKIICKKNFTTILLPHPLGCA